MRIIKKFSGFSLIELILVMLIVGIVSVIGGRIISTAYVSYISTKGLLSADWQGRQALQRMLRDIRIVRSPSDLTVTNVGALTFVTTSNETIAYSLSGTSLMRQKNAGTSQVLADGIQSLNFTYYDKNGNSGATLANVRFILISLNVVLNNTNFTITTAANLRDLA